MEGIVKELAIPENNICETSSANTFTVIVHSRWLKSLYTDKKIDFDHISLSKAEKLTNDWSFPLVNVFVKVISKCSEKTLPLPNSKILNGRVENTFTFSQLLQYVSQNNHKKLWKKMYSQYYHPEENKESVIINLIDHDKILSELIYRHYGCPIIKIKNKVVFEEDATKVNYSSKAYDSQSNLIPAICAIEGEHNFYIIYNNSLPYTLFDCLTFSPALLQNSNTSMLFVLYQLLQFTKNLQDRGLSIGNLTTDDIFMSENLWLQIIPKISDNIKIINNNTKNESKLSDVLIPKSVNTKEEQAWRGNIVKLEKICNLWIRCRISNLDYLIHLNEMAGRRMNDPQAHIVIPWVTDFTSRCGKNWRDLTKSKYRLTKGDRQLDLTYSIHTKDLVSDDLDSLSSESQLPHHVSDVLSDITYFVYMARRLPKEVLCKYVRNKWVPAEYPVSVQRMNEWTPDECIPQLYTDPSIFKSIHEDLADLELPSWATCAEDFVMKHREALESTYVSDNLHHWIDLTFGYKLCGSASVRAKNVCLSMVDGHKKPRRGGAVQLLIPPHPSRRRPMHLPPPTPLRIHKNVDKNVTLESSCEISEDEDTTLPQHISRLSADHQHRSRSRHKSVHLSRSQSKPHSPSVHNTFNFSKSEGNIFLPKDFDPVKTLKTMENLDKFNRKCFYKTTAELSNDTNSSVNLNFSFLNEPSSDEKADDMHSDEHSFINQLFLASYDQNYMRKLNQDMENERRNKTVTTNRFAVEISLYKSFIEGNKRRDMIALGCLIIEIFLSSKVRPLRNVRNSNLATRYEFCKIALKNNKHSIPKCVSYVATLLLKGELPDTKQKWSSIKCNTSVITDKGLPNPTAMLLLQPHLATHLVPFPNNYPLIYYLLQTLNEFEVANKELNILLTYECDGQRCNDFYSYDKTKLKLEQRIAEAKVWTCVTNLDLFINKLSCFRQFDAMEIFMPHFIELLEKRETAIVSVWYLFDTVAKHLGPQNTKKFLLKKILPIYDDEFLKSNDAKCLSLSLMSNREKSVKLYHNIFLLQLIVRFGLFPFLEHFMQHLVEAVGCYKDLSLNEFDPVGHPCCSKRLTCKKPRYSDELVKSGLTANASNIASPDTSFSSENTTNSGVDKLAVEIEKRSDNNSDTDIFLYETDVKETTNESLIDSKCLHLVKDESVGAEVKNSSIKQIPTFQHSLSEKIESLHTDFKHFEYDGSDTDKEFKSSKCDDDRSDSPIRLYKISDVAFESLIWLSHRLGPVLTCRYITRNLLKMLTLCYIGKENLSKCDQNVKEDNLVNISIARSTLTGDRNASKVIKCLTTIVALYGEQLIVVQYLPHMSELLASSRRRMTGPLEGGAVACLQLLKHLLPFMTDVKLMEQLQDVILKNIVHSGARLATYPRAVFPSGSVGRDALARKLVDASYALAVRLGSELTRTYILAPSLQRFFASFDKTVKPQTANLNSDVECDDSKEITDVGQEMTSEEYIEICRDGSTTYWEMRGGKLTKRHLESHTPSPDPRCTPAAQEEIDAVFTAELAYQTYHPFAKLVGRESMERALTNWDTVNNLCEMHLNATEARGCPIPSEALTIESVPNPRSGHCANSFGSNVSIVGNRIDIIEQDDVMQFQKNAHDIVSCKIDSDVKGNRHLRGDWLIYWEHEIGRADKDDQFNLKQMKLQTFSGHTQAVRGIYCMDNENSFMTASRDKTVRLWSLRNQGDGSAVVMSAWTYTRHRKPVHSITFVEALRLAVSCDSTVHIWDPYMESVVSQLESNTGAINSVRSLGNGSKLVLCAAETHLRLADANNATFAATLKVSHVSGTCIVRCVAACAYWIAAGLAGGGVCILESRTGSVLASWRAHDADITHIHAVTSHALLTSAADNTFAVWSPEDGKLLYNLKSGPENISNLALFKTEVVTATSSGRVGVHTANAYVGVRLRADVVRGAITALTPLPLNRCLLVGSDSGLVSLLC